MHKFVKKIPNLLTMTNMLLGLMAVLILIRWDRPEKAQAAAAFIVLGGVVDFFDGYLARKLNAVTELGKQLDSFADIITFGIAPVCLLHYAYGHCPIISAVSFMFPIAGVYRLARYNLNDFSDHFMGLPITVAGMLLALYCALRPEFYPPAVSTAVTAALVVALSVMMISKVKIKRIDKRADTE